MTSWSELLGKLFPKTQLEPTDRLLAVPQDLVERAERLAPGGAARICLEAIREAIEREERSRG